MAVEEEGNRVVVEMMDVGREVAGWGRAEWTSLRLRRLARTGRLSNMQVGPA